MPVYTPDLPHTFPVAQCSLCRPLISLFGAGDGVMRVNGVLAVSRTIGDRPLKEPVQFVSPVPEVKSLVSVLLLLLSARFHTVRRHWTLRGA
jgi:hypothetical protein